MVRKITPYEWTQLERNELGRLGNEDIKSFLVDLNRKVERIEDRFTDSINWTANSKKPAIKIKDAERDFSESG